MQPDPTSIRFLQPAPQQPDRPLFIFLPSMDGSDLSLQHQLAGMKAEFDLRCLCIPPNDRSPWPDLVDQVIHLIKLEQSLFSSRPVYLCGESFGGCLALKLAAHSPHLFDRLILINPASSFNLQPWRCLSPLVVGQMTNLVYHVATVGLLPLLTSLHRVSKQNRRALLQTMQAVPQESVAWRISLLCQFQLDEESLSQLTQPVLIIAAGADKLLPSLDEAQRLANLLPNVQQTVLPYSGHACLLEADIHLFKILSRMKFLVEAQATMPTDPAAFASSVNPT